MHLTWEGMALLVAIVVPLYAAGMIFRRWFKSRPHRFKDHDGNAHVWHPDRRFTDHSGRTVTDPRRIANLEKAWEEWHNPPGYPGP